MIILIVFGSLSGDVSFVYQISPWMFLALIPIGSIIAFLFYMIFKIRKMTRASWWLGNISNGLLLVCSYLIAYSLSLFILKLNALGGMTEQAIPNYNVNITVIISAVFLILVTLFLVVNYKKFNEIDNKALGKKTRIFVTVVSLLLIIPIMCFVLSAYVGTYETPFIGNSKAEKILGKKPIYFDYIPKGIKHTGTISIEENQVGLSHFGDTNDLATFMPIFETTKTPDLTGYQKEIIDGVPYYYADSYGENGLHRKILTFEKNGVYVSVISTDDARLSKNELIKVAKSAY